tara:strand:+ start:59 stop:601 length:543 start_codon:yes stop_codon:yes gene_type:complete
MRLLQFLQGFCPDLLEVLQGVCPDLLRGCSDSAPIVNQGARGAYHDFFQAGRIAPGFFQERPEILLRLLLKQNRLAAGSANSSFSRLSDVADSCQRNATSEHFEGETNLFFGVFEFRLRLVCWGLNPVEIFLPINHSSFSSTLALLELRIAAAGPRLTMSGQLFQGCNLALAGQAESTFA